jgi:hypothetical protein
LPPRLVVDLDDVLSLLVFFDDCSSSKSSSVKSSPVSVFLFSWSINYISMKTIIES